MTAETRVANRRRFPPVPAGCTEAQEQKHYETHLVFPDTVFNVRDFDQPEDLRSYSGGPGSDESKWLAELVFFRASTSIFSHSCPSTCLRSIWRYRLQQFSPKLQCTLELQPYPSSISTVGFCRAACIHQESRLTARSFQENTLEVDVYSNYLDIGHMMHHIREGDKTEQEYTDLIHNRTTQRLRKFEMNYTKGRDTTQLVARWAKTCGEVPKVQGWVRQISPSIQNISFKSESSRLLVLPSDK